MIDNLLKCSDSIKVETEDIEQVCDLNHLDSKLRIQWQELVWRKCNNLLCKHSDLQTTSGFVSTSGKLIL